MQCPFGYFYCVHHPLGRLYRAPLRAAWSCIVRPLTYESLFRCMVTNINPTSPSTIITVNDPIYLI